VHDEYAIAKTAFTRVRNQLRAGMHPPTHTGRCEPGRLRLAGEGADDLPFREHVSLHGFQQRMAIEA
jgi:hypothetical protein